MLKVHSIIFIASGIIGISIIVSALAISWRLPHSGSRYTIAAAQGGDGNPIVWRLENETGQILLCALQPHVNSAIIDPNVRQES
jgi:hypothetical protein